MDKTYHHGDLRNSLIEAGIALVSQEGIKQFSLRKTAVFCGVSHAAPYSHFKNKDDLMKAMQEHVTAQFMDAMEATLAAATNANDLHLLVQLGKCYIMFFIKHPHYFIFLFSQPWMTIGLSMEADQTKNFPPYTLYRSTALRVLSENGYPEEKRKDAMLSMWATVHGLAAIATMPNVYYDEDWEEKIESIIWNK